MDVGGTLKNPTVLIVGATIGLAVLLAQRGGAGSPVQVGTVGPNASALYAATLDSNKNAMAAQVSLAQINGNIAVNQINAHVAEQSFAFRTIDNLNTLSAHIQMQREASYSGVINNAIAANAAVTMDASNNQTRLGLSYVDANKSITIARIQADAQKSISKHNLIGSIFGSVAKVATAAIGGPVGAAGAAIGGGNNNGSAAPAGSTLAGSLGGTWG